jgi:Asp-tRNA(Asn)/Glu-tRNA(Gln) amidotransferase A subunit family amidase
MYRTLGPILEGHEVLISPTLAIPAPRCDARDDDPDFTVNGKEVSAYLGYQMTYPFNLISQIPAMSVPSGTSPAGIPTGLQIVARTYDDHRVFRAAAAFERARPWRERRPPL